ncbi:leucyl aminopeptidase [Mangrovactinospora gilvigrisea]|uniref:Probable cytosol aminopeptidase n=1 Tax=Mangrovactinospora gilvigrisea TaxID=1428644 RepID=A0A1J7BFW3_9ACTN|nr:leucyl aminopeptidase [Mangrovactinospora gilvigrisea]OIV37542.1 leucyl aminopeptidase [Mangrovactinospora gilvigrisea]
MTALTLSTSSPAALRADVVVVGTAKPEDGLGGVVLAPGAEALDQEFGGKLAAVLETLGATGAEGETVKLPAQGALKAPVVLAVGLGKEAAKEYAPEALRRAAGAAARALTGTKKAVFALPVADAEAVGAIAAGTLLGAYSFDVYKDGKRDEAAAKGAKAGAKKPAAAATDAKTAKKAPLAEASITGGKPRDKAHKAALDRAVVLAEETNRARDLVNTPSNDLDPSGFAAIAQAVGKEHGLKVEVLDEKALTKGGYGGILGVGKGSATPPRLVKVSWKPARPKASLAFVGKGITYDSGGISLKPAGHNETMKCDMGGAAAAFAAAVIAARLQLPVSVTAWLALAENMPSGSATRPGDVLRMYNGKTVEVLNTDAEGRLVMADALSRASEENPDALLDIATLTGAMMVALGERTFGVMGNDDVLRDTVVTAAGEAGEGAWAMPMPEELRATLDSPIADLQNIGKRMGGGLSAGVFLKEFVGEGISWAHLDIAGPAFNEGGPHGYTPKGGTGSAVATLVRLAETAAEGGLSA